MTQEDKNELLLKELSARLPYGVKVSYYGEIEECDCCDEIEVVACDYVETSQYVLPIEAVTPYLFPLSSMTMAQKKEYWELLWDLEYGSSDIMPHSESVKLINWFNKNHFDYSGLIPKGLAIDCTNLNIY